jgi:hypothetical protein
LLWPPPQPNLALQYLAIARPDPFIASEAMNLAEGHRRMLDDGRRATAEANQRQREREEREQAEAKAAAEAARAAWHARQGWPT